MNTKKQINKNAEILNKVCSLNASAEKAALSSNLISISSSDPGLVPFINPISLGLGK